VRKFPIVAGLLVVALSLVACGSSDSGGGGGSTGTGGGEKQTIAASLYSRDVPFYQAIADGLEQQSKEYGWDLKLTFSRPDPSEQIDAINTLLAQQPDGLVIVPMDAAGLVPAAKQGMAQDVPVIALADRLADRTAETAYVGGDFIEFGRTKAKWIADQLHGRGKVGVIHGIRGISFTQQQDEGLRAEFARYPGITIVDGPYAGNFTADLGLTATQNLLTANPDLDAIYFDNDDLALGGARAVADRGLRGRVLVVGTDGLEAGLAGVRSGDLDYTLNQCAKEQGREAIRVFHDLLVDGRQPPPEVITETVEVTRANVDRPAC
jgi:ABC-type sugar transport system substrate-binding protein